MNFIRHTQYTKAKYTVYSKRGATGSSQRASDPLMGCPVTETIRTESSATSESKNYYQDITLDSQPEALSDSKGISCVDLQP